ncbi:MAG: DUF58 domain-containing protein [Arachnia propionica]|uniref:DUF58 domain-containing protein n=1 Tax=Arachnia propionica TaxID=1750 RepID=UPI0026F7D951|nr:DUF58 domain-containing protein [Arachnia propionica]
MARRIRDDSAPPIPGRGLWARLVRNPVTEPITPLGWFLLGLVTVGAIPAWSLGWLEFRALWIIAAVVLILAVLSVMGRSQHLVIFELDRPRVQAGETVGGRVVVTAAGGRRSVPSTLEFSVDDDTASFRVPELAGGTRHEERFSIPTTTRGVVRLGPVRSVQADPLLTLSRIKMLSGTQDLFVHPRIIAAWSGAIGFLRDVEGITTSNLSSSDVSFHALREYVPGDDRRSVHWRTTARVGKLMVRQFEETLRAHLLILLSTRTADYTDPDDFELAVSVAGSLGASALQEERQVTFVTSTEEVRFPGAIGLLDRLSGVACQEEAPTMRQVAARHANAPGLSVVALVTGNAARAELRGVQRVIPPGVFSFALRCSGESRLSRSRVGPMSVIDLAELEQLRPALRSLR